MNIDSIQETLRISQIKELTSVSAAELKDQARLRFTAGLKNMDFDASTLEFIDSSGLGALISLQKLATERGGRFRLIAPKPTIVQVLELTRLHRVFDIVPA